MDQTIADTDEKDLERLFAEARKYPLLTAEQEGDIDGSKWAAVHELERLLTRDAAGRTFLRRWCKNCAETPPDVSRFRSRDLHFILRREVGDYLSGGKSAHAAQTLHSNIANGANAKQSLELLQELKLPASLVVGLVATLMRNHNIEVACSVADALQQWQLQWPAERASKRSITESNRLAMTTMLQQYNDARDTLTMHNLRLVYSIAGRNRGKGVNFLDMVQEGTLGLIRAAEKFEHSKGFRFSTYCFNWITQSIRRYVGDTAGLIRYPTHVQEQVNKVYRERLDAVARTGFEPSDAELAEAAGLSLEKIRGLKQLRNLGISLDAPQYDEDDSSTMLDTMPGGPFQQTTQSAETESLQRCLLTEMDCLEPAEREVVIARWGLHQGPALSRAEIADRMSVSREWVRQLESSALKKLKNNNTIQSAYQDYSSVSAW
ncbi:MAG: RNA polymerase sigma factor RpoD/SigA [Halieaceae bacterium]